MVFKKPAQNDAYVAVKEIAVMRQMKLVEGSEGVGWRGPVEAVGVRSPGNILVN